MSNHCFEFLTIFSPRWSCKRCKYLHKIVCKSFLPACTSLFCLIRGFVSFWREDHRCPLTGALPLPRLTEGALQNQEPMEFSSPAELRLLALMEACWWGLTFLGQQGMVYREHEMKWSSREIELLGVLPQSLILRFRFWVSPVVYRWGHLGRERWRGLVQGC